MWVLVLGFFQVFAPGHLSIRPPRTRWTERAGREGVKCLWRMCMCCSRSADNSNYYISQAYCSITDDLYVCTGRFSLYKLHFWCSNIVILLTDVMPLCYNSQWSRQLYPPNTWTECPILFNLTQLTVLLSQIVRSDHSVSVTLTTKTPGDISLSFCLSELKWTKS